jgi:hypothetical protein
MYQCYYDYMNLCYEDNEKKRLWSHVFKPGSRQNDLFNVRTEGHPRREFCDFETIVTGTDPDEAFTQVVAMMDAITDQGEGSELKKKKEQLAALTSTYWAVEPIYQASCEALTVDYPSYTDTGERTDSADAKARYENGASDHYERFTQLGEAVREGKVTTWPTWYSKLQNKEDDAPWKATYLETGPNQYNLPSGRTIAEAMNKIRNEGSGYNTFSQAAVGAIAGITTVLDKYWDPESEEVLFPYPSMVGSGDRMAICWALFGKAPDLSQTVKLAGGGCGDVSCPVLHACQGLDFGADKSGKNDCAQVDIFHSCRGSNACKAQGGCGFVQMGTGGESCSFALVAAKTDHDKAGDDRPLSTPALYGGIKADGPFSAPGDNKCGGFGGCAVPISASQVFPREGTMQLFRFDNNECDSVPIETSPIFEFKKGEKVHDVAYRAYREVMKCRGKDTPEDPPQPNNLRLAFPPST